MSDLGNIRDISPEEHHANNHAPTEADALAEALEVVKAAGYVALKEKSYRAAQERQRIAAVRQECAEARTSGAERWARECIAEERRLAARLTFVYGVAMKHGATTDELRGEIDA